MTKTRDAVLPCEELRNILLRSFAPCSAFRNNCASMRWLPQVGHVPRGFLGATGRPSEVRLILVVAEPGDPHPPEPDRRYGIERYAPGTSRGELLKSVCWYTYTCFRDRKDLFHKNVRSILDACWPDLTFDKQLRRTWITESVLCSARVEGGNVPAIVTTTCGNLYLKRELDVLNDAVVVALGNKARDRLARLGLDRPYLSVGSAAPPGCNQTRVRESWKAICKAVRSRMASR